MDKLRGVVAAGLFLALAAGAATAWAGQGYVRELPYVPGQLYPEGAQPGEEWCLYQYPPTMKMEKQLVRPEMPIDKPVPAVYGRRSDDHQMDPEYSVGQAVATQWQTSTKTYIYRPAYNELRVIPARFEERTREVEVCAEFVEEYWEPAQFATETKTFVICPERKELRAIPCVDGSGTLCYVIDVLPEQVQSVSVKTLVRDGEVRTRTVAAKYATVVECVLVAEATTEQVPVAAIERTYQVSVAVPGRVQVSRVPAKVFTVVSMTIEKEASTVRELLPAVYRDVQVVEEVGRTVWRLQQPTYRPPAPPVAIPVDTNDDYGSVPGGVTPVYSRFGR